jgi:GH15 family glucan-1,4-alpha-glucosidase
MTIAAGSSPTLGDPLARRSVDVLKSGQARSGAFVACPAFSVYDFAWLRDGAFCARALDAVGERGAAAAFHSWVTESIEAHRPLFESAIHAVGNGETPAPHAMPPARYRLDGTLELADDEPWPNFQVDGYGMWLWALEQHLGTRRPGPDLARTVSLVARYLAASWPVKCFNCWEEFDGGEHASTLGAVVAGIEASARMLDDPVWAAEADVVRTRLLEGFVRDGRFHRGSADDRLDASLLWLSVPFGVLPPDDERIVRTVAAVRRELAGPGGGLYRYLGDTYYGGGQWLLLTSSLAWHDAVAGHLDAHAASQEWVRGCALENHDLPEQVCDHPQDASMVEPWVRRWGSVATPLLWSHAMYLIAETAAR